MLLIIIPDRCCDTSLAACELKAGLQDDHRVTLENRIVLGSLEKLGHHTAVVRDLISRHNKDRKLKGFVCQ